MSGESQAAVAQPRNFICNFRAPSHQAFQRWRQYVQWAKVNGLDVCHLTLSLTDSFLKGVEGAAVQTSQQVIHIHQDNSFQYVVQRPRREPYSLSCVKPEFRRTFSSLLFEAYVLEKARGLRREFSFRDFLELKHDAFRRIVLRLRRKGYVVANPARTVPRFYLLADQLEGDVADWRRTE